MGGSAADPGQMPGGGRAAVNAPSTVARTAVWTAAISSRASRHSACAPAAIAVASAAARYPMAARSAPSASRVLAKAGVSLIGDAHLQP